MPNRLAQETSPYLLQHQNNPVDWYPWGEEAFAKAQAENKPVFLSVGYSSCHWCHVMEHESFEDEETATLMNDLFVNVKVDREERPDVDETYMLAVQLTSGRGGWPMSVFMTPDKKPFFAGTYFPREDRGNYPGFKTVLRQIGTGWKTTRAEFQKAADEFSGALREARTRSAPRTFAKLDWDLLNNAVKVLASDFDGHFGGFGEAPKFPPHTSIEYLIEYAATPNTPEELADAAAAMALRTLESMALGGVHDHIGGGFHRYSTDRHWLLPHFEKMLYDNALLLGNYARAARAVSQADADLAKFFTCTAAGIVEWLETEMRSPEGLFYSALDADSEGEEGKFYLWSEEEVREVLGGKADAFLTAYRFDKGGNYEDEATGKKTGLNIPHLEKEPEDSFDDEVDQLRAKRATRIRPGLDDKCLVGWNGLAIAGLVEAGELELAEAAASACVKFKESFGSLPHQVTKGVASGDAFLEDYAYLAYGLFRLAEQDPKWAEQAVVLTAEMIDRFYDSQSGGFYSTSNSHEELFGRAKPATDQPIPSGNAVAARCLLRMGQIDACRTSLENFVGWMERAPQATEGLLLAGLEMFEVAEVPQPEPAPASAAPVGEVVVSLARQEIEADASGVGRGEVVITIPEGLHINSNSPSARWLTPTTLSFGGVKPQVEFPPTENDEYRGTVRIPFTVQLSPGQKDAEFEVKVGYQACTDKECLLPVEKTLSGVVLKT